MQVVNTSTFSKTVLEGHQGPILSVALTRQAGGLRRLGQVETGNVQCFALHMLHSGTLFGKADRVEW